MATTFVAVVALIVFFVPGYLFQNGFREYQFSVRAERDLFAIAQAVAISAILVTVILGIASWWGSPKPFVDTEVEDGITLGQFLFVMGLPAWYWLGKGLGKASARGIGGWSPLKPYLDKEFRRLARDVKWSRRLWVRVVRLDEPDVVGRVDKKIAEHPEAALALPLVEHWTYEEGGELRHGGGIAIDRVSILALDSYVGGDEPPDSLLARPRRPPLEALTD